MSFVNEPIKESKIVELEENPISLCTFLPLCYFWTSLLGLMISRKLTDRFTSKFYDTLMMKSGSPIIYLLSQYVVDVILHLWCAACLVLISLAFGLNF